MPYKHFDMPKYPVTSDMWDELKKEERPIVVYGMGNGADKLFDRLAKYDIQIADIFASDGFVRGHSYRGYRVKSFSEIKDTYGDFVILLSFASNRADVIDMLAEIDSQYDMYVPDMPIAGVDEYFDKLFYNSNYDKIIDAYESLSDDESRAVFESIVNYKLTGKMNYLLECYSSRDEMYSIMPLDNIKVSVDAGAYNGDTIREIKSYMLNIKRVYALEPDRKNFKKLRVYSEAEREIDIVLENLAAWNETTVGEFNSSGNRNATVNATASYEHSTEKIGLVKIDDIVNERVDYIKYDVEGAENEALDGSYGLIRAELPTLLVSLYHRSRDIFYLINKIKNEHPEYDLYLRRLRCLPAWEINLIAVKRT